MEEYFEATIYNWTRSYTEPIFGPDLWISGLNWIGSNWGLCCFSKSLSSAFHGLLTWRVMETKTSEQVDAIHENLELLKSPEERRDHSIKSCIWTRWLYLQGFLLLTSNNKPLKFFLPRNHISQKAFHRPQDFWLIEIKGMWQWLPQVFFLVRKVQLFFRNIYLRMVSIANVYIRWLYYCSQGLLFSSVR